MRAPFIHSGKLSFLFLLFCSTFIFNSFGQSHALSYRFSMDTKDTAVQVTLAFKGSKTGETVLHLPGEWAGQTALYNAIQSISVSGKKAVLSDGEDGSQRIIHHKPNTQLTVSYTLKQDFRGELVYPKNFRAVIQPEYFQFTGYSLLVHPEMDPGTIVTVRLDWSGLPADWNIGNSLHANSRTYKGKLQLGDFQNAVFVAGDFRPYQTQIKGKPVFVAMRGEGWQFSDSAFVERVNTIVSMERTFWSDFSEPYYFVSLIPFGGDSGYNGTSLHQAFMLAMTPAMPFENSLEVLMAHEYFHHWNGTRIVLKEVVPQENSWFSEGFTEYYTYLLLYENGILSYEQYVAQANKMISDYYLSPVRNEDKTTHGTHYWSSSDYQQIPYKKGFVYALYIDHLIRTTSHGKYSLNNVMFDLRDLQMKQVSLTDSTFTDLVNRYTGKDISDMQHHYIDQGATIPVEAGSLKNTALVTTEVGSFEVGFDVDASWEARMVIGVEEHNAAWNAGLRNGQVLKGISIYNGDVTKPAEIYLTVDGEEKIISYIPMSSERTLVPQFEMR
jgi:predicted metalloprotease with PDZ domain